MTIFPRKFARDFFGALAVFCNLAPITEALKNAVPSPTDGHGGTGTWKNLTLGPKGPRIAYCKIAGMDRSLAPTFDGPSNVVRRAHKSGPWRLMILAR